MTPESDTCKGTWVADPEQPLILEESDADTVTTVNCETSATHNDSTIHFLHHPASHLLESIKTYPAPVHAIIDPGSYLLSVLNEKLAADTLLFCLSKQVEEEKRRQAVQLQ